MRHSGADWIVGRPDTGRFVAVPDAGALVIRLLQSGLPAAEVRRRVEAETGRDVEIEAFVEALAALGFVRAVDGHAVDSQRRVRGYAALMVLGSIACVALAILVWVNITFALLTRAGRELSAAANLASVADALATIVLLLAVQALWVGAWWRRHGGRVRRVVARRIAALCAPDDRSNG